ncbi:hypothetical protein AGMMS49942_09120 [Spirochaetia bacterium]|nr:hypothetical protein AGMMS49942_09120 [Spirochaetia bacterium]
MYERENAFYEANIGMLREKYLDKEVVIAGDEILGVYDDLGTALDMTQKTHSLGSFTIKHIRTTPETIWIPSYFEGTIL